MKLPSIRPDLAEPVQRWTEELRRLAQVSGAQSQRLLAKRLNIAPATVRRYLTGERLPDRALITQLLELMQSNGRSVDESLVYRLHAEAQNHVENPQLRSQDELSTARSGNGNVPAGDHHTDTGLPGNTPIQPIGPTDAASGQPQQRPSRFSASILHSMSRRDLMIGAGTAVLGAFTGVGATWILAPGQEVRAQRAVQEDQKTQASEKPPLRVKVAERWKVDDTFGWVFPNLLTPDQERRLLSTSSAYDPGTWAATEGGLRIGATQGGSGFTFSRLRLTIEGQWVKPVLVTEIHARVRRRLPPLSGALVWAGSEGGTEVIEIGFNLDEDEPVARVRIEDQQLGEPYTDRHAISLEPGEIVPIDVLAQTTQHYCEWELEFTMQVDGAERAVPVNNGGNLFRTSAFAERYDMRYFFDIQPPGRWYSAGPGGTLR